MDPSLPSLDGGDRAAAPSLPDEPSVPRHSLALYLYTGATIVAGAVALAWASLTFPIWPTISLTKAGGPEGILLGMVFWIALGLLGGTRVQHLHGHGVLTFHLPFIIAATALGGPVAGGWVAVFATFEMREFREVPWYGTLANHASIALSAVLAGVVLRRRPERAAGRRRRRRSGRRAARDRRRHVHPVRPVGRAGGGDRHPARSPDRAGGHAPVRHVVSDDLRERGRDGLGPGPVLQHHRLVGGARQRVPGPRHLAGPRLPRDGPPRCDDRPAQPGRLRCPARGDPRRRPTGCRAGGTAGDRPRRVQGDQRHVRPQDRRRGHPRGRRSDCATPSG